MHATSIALGRARIFQASVGCKLNGIAREATFELYLRSVKLPFSSIRMIEFTKRLTLNTVQLAVQQK
jgi:hypothetical protein